ncbi:DOPA 4,5-dioxygenase family protein [Vibrio tetraodonis]|uniref:DOPA 4,5-dioxygenase family protein n=1 Tax=Vibrio tetraodonis TaxID=2231647 RepID=UPI000E09F639|nr:DOPA 4,5-dioxygenase family protein [Vibrio tetraodonis]
MTFPTNIHQSYHAHVYFDAQTSDFAAQLRSKVTQDFTLAVGRFHQKLVGPHTMWNFSISFEKADFEQLIPWLDNARGGLSILVHAVTGDDITDHTEYAYWLGKPVELNLSALDNN